MLHTSGYNALYAPWTGMGFPNTLQPSPGQPELSWEEFCTNLEAADVRRLRVGLFGWNEPIGTRARSFEPRLGTWNDWGGRLGDAVEAARAHGVGFQVLPFHNREFLDWSNHAWNRANGGFLDDPRDAFSDPRAIAAGKARIAAILDACGDTILSWELMGEMSNMIKPFFWTGTTDWSTMLPVVRDVLVPWVEEMVQYIKSLSGAPVGNGQIFAPHGFDPDPAHPSNLRNEVHRTPSLDCAFINWYGSEPIAEKLAYLRACQGWAGKPIYVEQYAPWDLKEANRPDPPYTREPEDYSWSKLHEWVAVCGERGAVGPLRWPEIRPFDERRLWWGVASPEMAAIAGTTAAFAQTVRTDAWADEGQSWDAQIESVDLNLCSSWGDGRHVTAFLRWATSAQPVTISGLSGDQATIYTYDYLDGTLFDIQSVPFSGGSATFSVSTMDNCAAFYVEPASAPQPDIWTLEVQAVLERNGEAVRTFQGTLEEVG